MSGYYSILIILAVLSQNASFSFVPKAVQFIPLSIHCLPDPLSTCSTVAELFSLVAVGLCRRLSEYYCAAHILIAFIL